MKKKYIEFYGNVATVDDRQGKYNLEIKSKNGQILMSVDCTTEAGAKLIMRRYGAHWREI